jgi:hypothetical protein
VRAYLFAGDELGLVNFTDVACDWSSYGEKLVLTSATSTSDLTCGHLRNLAIG